MELTHLAVCGYLVVAADDLGFEAGYQGADGLILAGRFRTHAGNCRGALRDAVAIEQGETKFLLDARLQFEIERRAGDGDQAERAAVQFRQAGDAFVLE